MALDLATSLAVIFLVAETVIIVAIFGAIIFGLWRGATIASQWLRAIGMPNAKKYSQLVADETSRYSDKITSPMLKADEQITQVTATMGAIPRILKKRRRS
ncbi:MAG: hypothetical protein J5I90_06890 [Caldilineales bacterium]|nr:hypothetical protein [Caldilineales bacterium]